MWRKENSPIPIFVHLVMRCSWRLCLMFGESAEQIRMTVRILHLLLDAILTIFLFRLACRFSGAVFYRCLAGAVARRPHAATSAFVRENFDRHGGCFLTATGVVVLCRLESRSGRRQDIDSYSYWEPLAEHHLHHQTGDDRHGAPVVALALLTATVGWRRFLTYGIVASVPFLFCVLAMIAYRVHVAGETRVFGKLVGPTPGLTAGQRLGLAPEPVKQTVLWDALNGVDAMRIVPDAAFDSESEKDRITAIMGRIHQAGRVTKADDSEFLDLANERIERQPWRHYLWVPLCNTALLWINRGISPPYLYFFARLPHLANRILVDLFFGLRLAVFASAAAGTACLCWRSRSCRWTGWADSCWLGPSSPSSGPCSSGYA